MDFAKAHYTHPAFMAAQEMSAMSGCAKQRVGAVIWGEDGKLLGGGSNDVSMPRSFCPRVLDGFETGEGYELCKLVCQQVFHAEIAALAHAELTAVHLVEGASLYLWGHEYVCGDCAEQLREAGIAHVYLPVDEIGRSMISGRQAEQASR